MLGSRKSQAVLVCKNLDCGWPGNVGHNAARNVVRLYRMGLALILGCWESTSLTVARLVRRRGRTSLP